MRAAVHARLDTLTTHWYFTHFLCDNVESWATGESAHLKTMDLYGEIVSSYTLAYDALNAEITETQRLDHKMKKRNRPHFPWDSDVLLWRRGRSNTRAGAVRPGAVLGP